MSETEISLYGRKEAGSIPWPDNSWNLLVKKFIPPFLTDGPASLINNISSEMMALKVDDRVFPIVFRGSLDDGSYLCSPYNHYVVYGNEELEKLGINLSRPLVSGGLKILGSFLRAAEIDKNVFVNDWLLPTNLYPKMTKSQLEAITRFLVKKFPDHAVVFRSINDKQPPGMRNVLKELGFNFVPSRMVYFTDPSDDQTFKSRMFKSDIKLMEKSPYTLVQGERVKQEVSRVKNLYWDLNIDKYSKLNPQFNERYILHALESGWMTLRGFEWNGSIDAVFGYIETDQVITSPLFGLDTAKELEQGLYRLISTQLLLEAKEKGKLLHQSAGAGHYKKLRRAIGYPEYIASYCSHLPAKRRAGWSALSAIMNTVGGRFLDRV